MLFNSFRLLRNISLPVVGLLLSLGVGLCYVYQPYFIRFLDNKIYDIFLRRNHVAETSGLVEIIDIDEKSLEEFGQWPWPRYQVALLLQNLRNAGARAVGLDMIFAEPDRSSPIMLQKGLKKDLDVEISFNNLPGQLEDNDKLLADVLSQGPFVLGFFFDFEKKHVSSVKAVLKPIELSVVSHSSDEKTLSSLLDPENVIAPISILSEAATATGFINTVKDRDGILRTTPILMKYKDKIYPNLGLATLWAGLGKPSVVIKITEGGVESLRIGSSIIPLNRSGRFALHFRGKQHSFPYHSAADVLNDKVSKSDLNGKILLVGTSAIGLEDLKTTPLDAYFPGVEAQATLVDNILTGDFIKAPDWVPGLEFVATIIAGFLSVLLISVAGTRVVFPVITVLACLCWILSEFVFKKYHFFFSPLFPFANLAVTFTCLTVLKMVYTENEKAHIRQAFSRYVSPSLVDQIANNPLALNLEGEEKEVTILFSDIRGFTSLSEKLSPTEVTLLLNQFLTPVTRIIRGGQGTLDKFIGDAVMAFWNAPLDVAGHRQFAVEAGLRIIEKLPGLNKKFQARFGVSIAVGIGIHSGVVRVGNMGSDDLFDYTILGDNVNLTSRLEGLTKFYGVPIIVSEALHDIAVDNYQLQELDTVRVKGKENPVTLFTFRGRTTLEKNEIEVWQEGIESYKEGKFAYADNCFETLHSSWPENILYKIYHNRCLEYLQNPPTEWTGIFSHVNK
jgi:adenylate cyclase